MELVLVLIALVVVPILYRRRHPVHVERFETMRTSLDQQPTQPTTRP